MTAPPRPASQFDWRRLRRGLLSDLPLGTELQAWLDSVSATLLAQGGHGDLPRWRAAEQDLSQLAGQLRGSHTQRRSLDRPVVQLGSDLGLEHPLRQALEEALLRLSPWRKGPIEICGVHIDSEWRSDLKWERVAGAVDFRGRTVLDVGCGNGYYGYRALGAGARCVLGVDPTDLYVMQFSATRHFAGVVPAWVLPLRMEDLPPQLECFDLTLSMGVLYHRPSPFDHLRELRLSLKPGGTLVLETLVIAGGPREVLVPEGRYAGMRNVYFLPSCQALASWLRRAGFTEVMVVDQARTTADEQRATRWSQGHSLQDFLDPTDPLYTVEGEPAPLRAVFVARRS